MDNPWERFGYTLYRLGKNPKGEKEQADLENIIQDPGDPDLERMIRFLHLDKG